MPTYDYLCESNGRVVEVKHRISEVLSNWGELCEHAGIALDDTPADAPVKKLPTGGNVVRSRNLGSGNLPPCASGGCSGGMCGLN